MSTMYPLAIINTPPCTSLVRITPYHHVCHGRIKATKRVTALSETTPSTTAENPLAQLTGNIPGPQSAKNQMATEPKRTPIA